jgi:hypothetical protein
MGSSMSIRRFWRKKAHQFEIIVLGQKVENGYRISGKIWGINWDNTLKLLLNLENIVPLKKMYNKNYKKFIHYAHVQQQSERRCGRTLLVKKNIAKKCIRS